MAVRFDVATWPRVVETMVEDRRRSSFWAAAARGTATVIRWEGHGPMRAERGPAEPVACAESARLRHEAARLRRRASH